LNISSLITKHASFQPYNTAIICGDDGRKIKWFDLDRIINKLSNALVYIGVKRGDVVSLYLPNSPEFIFAYFAATRIGAIILPFNLLFRTREISYILTNSRAKVIIGSSEEVEKYLINFRNQFPDLKKVITVGSPVKGCLDFYELIVDASDVIEPVNCNPEDLGLLGYTSGTSGNPKGVMLTYGNLKAIGNLNGIALHINDRDLLLTGTPFCHICFVLSVLGPFMVGAGVITMRRFKTELALELIERYQITHFTGVPTMLIFMLEEFKKKQYNLSSLRLVHCAGAPMPTEYINEISQIFEVNYLELYGATETTSTVSYNRMGHSKSGSIGQPAYGVQVKVVNKSGEELPPGEIGEIIVKGPGIFKGYWQMPEATQKVFYGEWYRTGDMGKFDEDGYLYFIDRLKDVIVSGGYNIYPKELEEVIYQHPNVKEVAILGLKDPVRNEVPKAFITLKDDAKITEDELIKFCSQRMASYKVPRFIEILPELPKSSTGKILKKLLTQSK